MEIGRDDYIACVCVCVYDVYAAHKPVLIDN